MLLTLSNQVPSDQGEIPFAHQRDSHTQLPEPNTNFLRNTSLETHEDH